MIHVESDRSTRELIKLDKQLWKHQQHLNPETSSLLLSQVCNQLGISNAQDLPQCIDRICVAVKLIPQMKQFINEITGIITAFSKDSPDQSVASSTVYKLNHIIQQVRLWAEQADESQEIKAFVDEIHHILGIPHSAASLALCREELKQTRTSPKALYADIPADAAQQAVGHFRDLFEIKSATGVLPRMNDLYVFWAEVNDGLSKIQQLLEIDQHVQPGRVLIHALEALEKSRH